MAITTLDKLLISTKLLSTPFRHQRPKGWEELNARRKLRQKFLMIPDPQLPPGSLPRFSSSKWGLTHYLPPEHGNHIGPFFFFCFCEALFWVLALQGWAPWYNKLSRHKRYKQIVMAYGKKCEMKCGRSIEEIEMTSSWKDKEIADINSGS